MMFIEEPMLGNSLRELLELAIEPGVVDLHCVKRVTSSVDSLEDVSNFLRLHGSEIAYHDFVFQERDLLCFRQSFICRNVFTEPQFLRAREVFIQSCNSLLAIHEHFRTFSSYGIDGSSGN